MTPPSWSGYTVTQARAHWRARLPLPCYRCGRPVIDGQRWHVEHIVPREFGGSLGVENQWVSHAGENESAGGKRGAQITNAAKVRKNPQATTRIEPRPLQW